MKKRLTLALAAGALMAAMLPGVASAKGSIPTCFDSGAVGTPHAPGAGGNHVGNAPADSLWHGPGEALDNVTFGVVLPFDFFVGCR